MWMPLRNPSPSTWGINIPSLSDKRQLEADFPLRFWRYLLNHNFLHYATSIHKTFTQSVSVFSLQTTSLRGEQKRSLCTALQGFPCSCFVSKLHNPSPCRTTAIICHDNSSFHRPKLRKRLMEEGGFQVKDHCTESSIHKYPNWQLSHSWDV